MRCSRCRNILVSMSVIVLLWGTVKGQNAGSIAVNRNALYNSYTPAQLVQNVLITGCLTASNVQWSGYFNATDPARRQLGYFNKGTSNFPISEGLILSTGYARTAEGPNNIGNRSQNVGGAGDADLTSIAGDATHDAAVLQFDFIPAGNTLEFQYIFSSEEYLEYVDAGFNDAFGFFLSRPGFNLGPYINNATNIALIPSTTTPVTIDNVNDITNSAYYTNNPAGTLSTQFDGMTVVMTATYPVVPCTTYHIKLAVGDARDYVYDSAVFLKARSFNSEPIGASTVNTNVNLPDYSNIFEGCLGNQIVLQRDPAYISQPATVQILYGGTATNGVDVKTIAGQPLPATVTIPAGVLTYTIDYSAVDDGIPDAGEDLKIQVLQSCPCDPNPVYVTKTITIWEKNLTVTAEASNIACGSTNSGSITAISHNGSGDNLFSIDGVNWQGSNLFPGLAEDTYTIWAKNVGSCADPVSTSVTINSANDIVANAGPDSPICTGESIQLQGSGGSIYSWYPQNGLSDPEIANPVASPTETTTYTLTVKDPTGACTATDDVTVNVSQSPVAAISPANGNVCIGNSITLMASGGGTYSWNLLTPDPNPSITVSPVTSTSYTVIVTGANGCKADANVNVVVHPLPTAVISGSQTNCSGAQANLSVTLTGTAPWTFQYSDGTTTVTKIANTSPYNFLVNPTVATTYTLVSVTDYWGCVGTDITGSATINISPLPTAPTYTGVDDNNFCPDPLKNITLTASGGDYGTSIEWRRGNCDGTQVGTGASIDISSPATTTTYYARNLNSCGVSACLSITVNIKTAPTAPLTIETGTNPSSYCTGSTMPQLPYRLQANGAGNATGYEWFKDVGCGVGTPIKSGTSSIYALLAPPAVTTTYLVRSTNTNGCKSSNCALLTIAVFPPSDGGSISGADAVCSGNNNGELKLSGHTGDIIRWESSINGGSTWISIGNANSTTYTYTNITQNTLYRAVVQNGSGPYICAAANSSTATITMSPPPTPGINGPAFVCINSDNTFTTEAGMSNYNWTVTGSPFTIISGGTTTENTITVKWTGTGTKTVRVNYANASGCTAASQFIYSVTAVGTPPTPTSITPSLASTYCANTPPVGIFRLNAVVVASPGVTYEWFSGSCGGTPIPTSTSSSLTLNPLPSVTTTYFVRSKNACGVSDCASITITVNAAPTISLGTNPSVCKGTTSTNLIFSATTGSPNRYSIDYDASANTAGFVDVTNATLAASPIVLAVPGTATAGEYNGSLTVNNSTAGCGSIAYPIKVTVNALPTITGALNVCVGKTIPWSGSGTPDPTIPWSTATADVATVFGTVGNSNTAQVTGVSAGTSDITFRDNNGCSQIQKITVIAPLQITSPTNKKDCYGSSVTFNGGTYGEQVHYQWQRKVPGGSFIDIDGASGNPNGTPILLTLNNIGQNGVDVDQTQYRVIITPTAFGCEVISDPATLTVNPNITPTFAAVAPICSGATLSALPTTSTNGITGTWSPALNNTATTTYTFTPTTGQCATTTILKITVNPLPTTSAIYHQ